MIIGVVVADTRTHKHLANIVQLVNANLLCSYKLKDVTSTSLDFRLR